ncbi:hypothetical protein RBSH_03988 [Rhodopirellula baltica SH28]|uniref:Uncharacterized protein n=1 Tax=Rhodopirellula baltica SH28 TaxID=993517 RepID=K5CBB3_RHOBT|nr:hypothetical protein RBSH_03988 [Rhodopirellula baltica SH28]
MLLGGASPRLAFEFAVGPGDVGWLWLGIAVTPLSLRYVLRCCSVVLRRDWRWVHCWAEV